MESLKPNALRASYTITLIWIVMLMDVVTFISGYFQYDLLQSVANGAEITTEAATANDTREQVLGVIKIIIFLISGICFIRWFRRAYFNLQQKSDYLSETDGWAVGCWFVPIISFYKPYRMMKELYVETKDVLVNKGIELSTNFTTSYLGWWWTFWIINSVMGQFLFRSSLSAETLDELITVTIFGMIVNIIGIPLAIITVKVVKDYSRVEPLLFEIVEEEETAVVVE